MIVIYPSLTAEQVDRQGKRWMFCDVASCDEQAEVTDTLPKGWGTSDPDDDPIAGAAQFCPKHTSRLPAE